jgi:hypothetical protein
MYLISIRDKDGDAFDGGKTYRLTVPLQSAGRAVLVRDGLRPPDACADPQHGPREPFVTDSRVAEERGRRDRRLLRSDGAGGQGKQLGADRPGAQVRADVPRLRTDQGPCSRRPGCFRTSKRSRRSKPWMLPGNASGRPRSPSTRALRIPFVPAATSCP